MADKKKTTAAPVAPAAEPRKKADVIIEKLDCLLSSTTEVINRADKAVASSTYISRQNSEIYERTLEENANIKQQIKYIAAQSQSVYDKMAAMVTALSDKVEQLQRVIDGRVQLTAKQIADEVETRFAQAETDEAAAPVAAPVEIDYEKLAAETVSRIDYEKLSEEVVVRFNYEAIVDDIEDLLAEHLAIEDDEYDDAPAPAPAPQPAYYEAEEVEESDDDVDIDYDELADKVAERITPAGAPVEIDYDLLAEKVAQSLPTQEDMSADYIASKVAEQIVIPDPDYDKIADAVFDKLYEDTEDVAEEENDGSVEEEYTPDQEEAEEFAADEQAAEEAFDYEKLATLVAEKLTAADEEAVEEEYEPFDYEKLATLVAEKLAPVEEEVTEEEASEEDAEEVTEEETAEEAEQPEEVTEEETAEEAEQPEEVEEDLIDYEKLATLVAEKISVPEVSEENIAALVAEKLTPAEEEVSEEAVEEQAAEETEETAEAEEVTEEEAAEEPAAIEDTIDYEKLASAIVERMTLPELSEESIAELVAEKVSMSEYELTVDEEKIAELVAEKLLSAQPVPAEEEVVESAETAETVEAEEVEEETEATEEAEEAPAPVQLTEETIAQMVDEISKRVCEFLPTEYDIVVDDAGCEELAHAISEKLDKQAIAAGIAEQVIPAIQTDAEEPDYDEIALKLSEKLTAPEVNEDALAEKAAAVLSNYMPEIDTDEICDRITAAILAAMPATGSLDYEAVSQSVSEKLIEAQSDSDYDIIIDDEGIAKITESVAEKLNAVCNERLGATEEKLESFEQSAGERFDKIETDVTEIKDMLVRGAVASSELAAAEAEQIEEPEEEAEEGPAEEIAEEAEEIPEEPAEQPVEEPVEETTEENIEEPAEETIEETEEQAEEQPAEDPTEEPAEEAVEETEEQAEEPAEQPAEEEQPEEELVTVSDVIGDEESEETAEADEVIDEIVEDIDEQPVDGEVMPDGIEGISSPAVDFANMMKYNRSFIARIIQGSDDVKRYYGATKTALLSYKKVNSSVAWGAERFNKGRETIAKFKIRGKTLCLYLNLNPNDYKTSVYHQVDVSDNKSMATTPMMVKIKSPLGVKKAIRLIDDMLAKRDGVKQNVIERDYVAMYPYETIEELIEDGLVKDVSKNK